MRRFWYVFALLFVLIGCSQAETPPEATPRPTPLPESTRTPFPTAAPTIVPTLAIPAPEGANERVFVVQSAESSTGYLVGESFLIDSETILGRKRTTGEANTRGTTNDIEGYITLDFSNDTPELVAAEFQVNLLTLKTNRTERDQHIRQYNLESNIYPSAKFTATSIDFSTEYVEGEPVELLLFGIIQIRQFQRQAVLFTTATLDGDRLVGSAEAEFFMTDFGFDPPNIVNAVRVNNNFTIWVDLVAVAE